MGAATRGSKNLPKSIKSLRTKLGLTQEQFAAKVGVTFSTVNRWENGKSKPSPLALEKINSLQKKVTFELDTKKGFL